MALNNFLDIILVFVRQFPMLRHSRPICIINLIHNNIRKFFRQAPHCFLHKINHLVPRLFFFTNKEIIAGFFELHNRTQTVPEIL